MNAAYSSTNFTEIPAYAGLQRKIHDALRAQHPEWIEPDGKSPTCDFYEWRFAELLVSHRTKSSHAYAPSLPREKLSFQKVRHSEMVLHEPN